MRNLGPSALFLTVQLFGTGGCRHRDKSTDSVDSAASPPSACDLSTLTLQNEVGGMHLVEIEEDAGQNGSNERLVWDGVSTLKVALVTPEDAVQDQMGITIERLQSQIEYSLSVWNNSDSLNQATPHFDPTVELIEESDVAELEAHEPDTVFVYVDDGTNSDAEAAFTYLGSSVRCSDGFVRIYEASITVHLWAIQEFGNVGLSMKYIFTHELGHSLGLAHSEQAVVDDGPVLMAPATDLARTDLNIRPNPDHEGLWMDCAYTQDPNVWKRCLAFTDTDTSRTSWQPSMPSPLSNDLVIRTVTE